MISLLMKLNDSHYVCFGFELAPIYYARERALLFISVDTTAIRLMVEIEVYNKCIVYQNFNFLLHKIFFFLSQIVQLSIFLFSSKNR